MATSAEIKAVVDHGFADVEALVSGIGKPELVAELEKVKAIAENPLVMEIIALAVTQGLSKLGLGLASAKPAA